MLGNLARLLLKILKDEHDSISEENLPITIHSLRKYIEAKAVPSFTDSKNHYEHKDMDQTDQDFLRSTIRLRTIEIPIGDIAVLHKFIWDYLYDKNGRKKLDLSNITKTVPKGELEKIESIYSLIEERIRGWQKQTESLEKECTDLKKLINKLSTEQNDE